MKKSKWHTLVNTPAKRVEPKSKFLLDLEKRQAKAKADKKVVGIVTEFFDEVARLRGKQERKPK